MYLLTQATEHLERFYFYKIRVTLLGRKCYNILKLHLLNGASPSPLMLYIRAGYYKSEYAHCNFSVKTHVLYFPAYTYKPKAKYVPKMCT